MNENELLLKCKEIYEHLKTIYQDESLTNIDTIKNMFSYLDGTVVIKDFTNSFYYDGNINNYTIGGNLYMRHIDSGYIRLIEDLTMAYYRTNGGTEADNTYEFLDKLKSVL